jgi:hypothetical protein
VIRDTHASSRTTIEPVSFEQHIELLQSFSARRADIAARIEALLNAQRRTAEYFQDVAQLARQVDDCFFGLPALAPTHASLRHQLEEAHRASGFKPRPTPGQPNDLVDPAEIMSRAFLMWQRTRWPGHHGRLSFAHTLFNLFVLRRLMLLAMRIWDSGPPGNKLAQLQRVLDELWRSTPAEQPVLVRDARSLFALAQSPTTDELHGYFEIAERIAETLADEDRAEILKANVRMAGGHLRSQLRHLSTERRVSLEEPKLVSSTRRSNALDVATLMQGLVPLLHAYEHAAEHDDQEKRVELADAICQGISPDPDLFLNRLDLLGPYTMIEYLFIAPDGDERALYTPMGQRDLRLLHAYTALIPRVARRLHEDCARFRPAAGTYSPYGVLYGFSSRLLEHMALKAAQPIPATRFSLEDVFVAGDADKLAWVSGWRNLPHVPREVVKLFEYPQRFAEAMFERIERALRTCAGRGQGSAAQPVRGRFFIAPEGAPPRASAAPPQLPPEFVVATDRALVAAGKAVAYDEAQLLHSRVEGELLVSYRTPRGWVAVTKDALSEVLGAGHDATIAGLPREAAYVLKLMCGDLAVLQE